MDNRRRHPQGLFASAGRDSEIHVKGGARHGSPSNFWASTGAASVFSSSLLRFRRLPPFAKRGYFFVGHIVFVDVADIDDRFAADGLGGGDL